MDLDLVGRHVLVTVAAKASAWPVRRVLSPKGPRVSLVARNPQTLAQAFDRPGRRCAAPWPRWPPTCAMPPRPRPRSMPPRPPSGPVEVLVNSAGAARRTPPMN
jgi:hypothetical protein